MKTMIIAIAAIMLLAPSISCCEEWVIQPRVPDYTRPFMEPGSVSNPYVVRDRYDGNLEIRSRYQDYSRPPFEAGSPSNPYIVRPVR